MRWTPRRRSPNLEDRRAESGRSRMPFPFPMQRRSPGGGARLPLPRGRGGKMSLGSVVLVVAVYLLISNMDVIDPTAGRQTRVPFPGAGPAAAPGAPSASPSEERLVDFVSFVLDDVQATWGSALPRYRDARLVLFRDSVRSGCGFAAAQMGPFYCPVDEKVYVDLSFYEDLHRRFGAPGDFAQAYVLAHEIGHHIQNVTGIEAEVRRAQRARPDQANALSVRMELQADCLAGVWGHAAGTRDILEAGDVEEGLRAAGAIGDDRLQRMQTGRVQPEGFTHGTSEQRQQWLRRGLESGEPEACNTFETALR